MALKSSIRCAAPYSLPLNANPSKVKSLKRRNIVFFIPSFTYGGTELHSLEIAHLCQKNGHRVVFAAFSRKRDLISDLESKGIDWFFIPELQMGQRMGLRFFIKAVLFGLKLRWQYRPDLIITATSHCNFLGGLVWKIAGAKSHWWHQWGIAPIDTPGNKEKLAVLWTPEFIANSQTVADFWSNRHLEVAPKITVIKNPLHRQSNMNRMSSEWDFHRFFQEQQGFDLKMVMTANFFSEKDHLTVIRALYALKKAYPEKKFLLVLPGIPPGQSLKVSEAKALAFDLGLYHEIIFPGALGGIHELLAYMDVGILSTLSEGMSNAAIEYLLAGLRVALTRVPANVELMAGLDDQVFFDVGDVQGLTHILERYLLQAPDPAWAEKVSDEVNKTFSGERFTQAYQQRLETIFRD
jgi:glycosyltransferase involved in cell wall biosynthesis